MSKLTADDALKTTLVIQCCQWGTIATGAFSRSDPVPRSRGETWLARREAQPTRGWTYWLEDVPDEEGNA